MQWTEVGGVRSWVEEEGLDVYCTRSTPPLFLVLREKIANSKPLTSILVSLLEGKHKFEGDGSEALLTLNIFQAHLGALDAQSLVIVEEAPEGEHVEEMEHDPHVRIAP